MNIQNKKIWFWQLMVTPHVTNLAVELAKLGCEVHYCANTILSEDRVKLGWSMKDLSSVHLHYYYTQADVVNLLDNIDKDSIHICQGIRANGLIKKVQSILKYKKIKYWIVMETVDDSGYKGLLKRLEYRRKLYQVKKSIHGVLAIGEKTSEWLIARGLPSNFVFPFSYFIERTSSNSKAENPSEDFTFIYIGQLIPRKRVDLLIRALSSLPQKNFCLNIVGGGSDLIKLKNLANQLLPEKVFWLGVVPMSNIPNLISSADCLVLPSTHDGWGAVISESLIVGTPAICSDGCGASEIVRASGVGGVFQNRNLLELTQLLEKSYTEGKINAPHRAKIAQWAKSLSGSAGADYLLKIIEHKIDNKPYPIPPWI